MASSSVASGAIVAALVVLGFAACRAQGYPFSQRGRVDQTWCLPTSPSCTDVPSLVAACSLATLRSSSGTPFCTRVPDSATRVTFSHDVKLEGRDVKAGEYTIWLIPRANKPWTFILSRAAHVFHIPYPGESSDVLRVECHARARQSHGTLAIYFPVVLRDEAVMRIHWGETIVPVRIQAPYRPE